jgi:hypothetical protein
MQYEETVNGMGILTWLAVVITGFSAVRPSGADNENKSVGRLECFSLA